MRLCAGVEHNIAGHGPEFEELDVDAVMKQFSELGTPARVIEVCEFIELVDMGGHALS